MWRNEHTGYGPIGRRVSPNPSLSFKSISQMQLSRLPKSIERHYDSSTWVRLEYKGVECCIDVRHTKEIAIYNLISEDRGKGYAKRMLTRLLAAAKRQGVAVILWASPFDSGGLDKPALISFYQRLGFTFENLEANHPFGVFNA